jgi:hypothetical protein
MEKITQFSIRRKALKGIQAWRTLRKKCAKRRKEKQFGKASRTEQL